MPKKNIPNSFDDSNLPKGKISPERSLEIDSLMKDRIEELKFKIKQVADNLRKETNPKEI